MWTDKDFEKALSDDFRMENIPEMEKALQEWDKINYSELGCKTTKLSIELDKKRREFCRQLLKYVKEKFKNES